MPDLTIPIARRDTSIPSAAAIRDGRVATVTGVTARAIVAAARVAGIAMLMAGNLLDESLVSVSGCVRFLKRVLIGIKSLLVCR